MRRSPLRPLCATLALCLLSLPTAAVYLDPAESTLAAEAGTPLRWDNIEGWPHLVSGLFSYRVGEDGTRRVVLGPGQETLLWLPAGDGLRLRTPARDLSGQDLVVAVSDGSGLFREMPFPPIRPGRDLHVQVPGTGPAIFSLRHPGGSNRETEIEIYHGRRVARPEIVPARDVVGLNAPAVRVGRFTERPGQRFYQLAAGQAVSFQRGQYSRLAFDLRLQLDSAGAANLRRFRFDVELDGRFWKTVDLRTAPERREALQVDGVPTLLGREETIWLQVPGSARMVSMRPSVPLLVRVRGQRQADFLLPELNVPSRSLRQYLEGGMQPLAGSVNRRDWTDASAYQLETLARGLARDNLLRDGGLAATAIMEHLGRRDAGLRGLSRAVQQVRGGSTFWKPVEAVSMPLPGAWPARVLEPALRDPGQSPERFLGAAIQAPSYLGELVEGVFHGLRAGGTAVRYRVPGRAFPSWLKVAVPADFRGRLQIEFDHGDTEVLVARGRTPLRPDAWSLGPGETGLLLSGHEFADHPWTVTGHGPVVRAQSPLVRVQTLQFELPARVREFSVRMLAAGEGESTESRVATWYRKSRAWSMDEWDYLYRVDEYLGPGRAAGLLAGALLAVLECQEPDPVAACRPDAVSDPAGLDDLSARAAGDLYNDWVSLLRLLHSRWEVFSREIAAPGQPPVGKPSAASDRHMQRAREQSGAGDHLAALESWSAAADQGGPRQFHEARLGQASALSALGEEFRAERLLRSLVVHGSDDGMRRAAAGRLAERYRGEGRLRLNTGVALALFRADPGTDTLAAVVAALGEEGLDDPALRAGLVLPPASRPPALATAAWRLQWRRALDRILAHGGEPERQLWASIAAVADGNVDAAREAFAAAGAVAAPWLRAMETGLEIRRGLASEDSETRRKAVNEWMQWWATHPGSRHFERDGLVLRDAAGTESLYVPHRDLAFEMSRAEAGRPVELEVIGPVQMELEVRPVHEAPGSDSEGPWDPTVGWLQVTTSTGTTTHPWNTNLPAEGIAPLAPGVRAGAEIGISVDVPDGRQRIRIAPRDGTILIAARASQPSVVLPVLPWPTPDLVAEALARPLPPTVRPRDPDRPVLVRHGLRAQLGTGSFQELAAIRSRPAVRGDEPVAIELDQPPAGPLERMRELQEDWIRRPSERQRILPEAARIAHQHRDDPRIDTAWSRMSGDGTEWRLLPSVYRSAGVRREPVVGWDPESPLLRARRAMMVRVPPGAEVLHGSGAILLEMENLRPVPIRFTLRALRLAGEPALGHRVAWSVDGGQEQIVTVDAGRGTVLRRTIGSGRHFVRFRLAEDEPGRYVALQMEEQRRPGVWTLLAIERERTFHVSTRDEPVVLRVDGPAWLRIDEHRDGSIHSQFMFVESPGAKQVLRPGAGRDEAVLRIFQLVPGRPVTRYASVVPVAEPLPHPDLVQPPPARLVGRPPPSGRLALPGQEDGTVSMYMSARLRRDTDPEGSGASGTGRLRSRDFGLQHRYRDDAAERYRFNEAFVREPWDGEPLLGLRSRLDHYPPQSPFDWGGQAEVYLQEFPGESPFAWSGTLRGFLRYNSRIDPATSHSARFSGFLRRLSLSPGDASRGDPDPDVYSGYKQDHLHGVGLSWAVSHEPWRDTVWEGGLGVNSNENLDLLSPDHHSARVAWRQLLGDAVIGVDYRFRHFENDRDRRAASSRNDISLEFGWEAWQRNSQRFEVQMTAQRDLERNQWLGLFSLVWHLGEGREYRDFRPGEIEFRDLRELRAPDEWNDFHEPAR